MSERELPEGWCETSLGKVIADGPTNGYSGVVGEGGTNTLKLSATTTGEMLLNEQTTKTLAETLPPTSGYFLQPGDLLVQRANSLHYLGAAAIYDGPPATYAYPDLMMRLRLSAAADTRYVWRWLNSVECRSHFQRSATGTAGNMPKINGGTLLRTPLPLPPLPEQKRIVARLDALQARSRAAREALAEVPALLDQLRQSVLAAAFRGDLTAEWRANNPDVEPASALLERIRAARRRRWDKASQYIEAEPWDSDADGLPEIPASWNWASVDEVGDVLLGRQRAPQYLTGRYSRPYLRVANIKDDWISYDDVEVMDFDDAHFAKYQLRHGDILVSEGQSLELVGQSAVYRGNVPGLCFQKTLHRFRPADPGPTAEYAQLVFRHWVKSGVFRRRASITTNIAHLTLDRFRRCPFPVAPLAEQLEITRRVSQLFGKLTAAAGASAQMLTDLTTLDQSILARAFRGELVEQDPNDEPAEVLLARIRAERASSGKPATRRGRG